MAKFNYKKLREDLENHPQEVLREFEEGAAKDKDLINNYSIKQHYMEWFGKSSEELERQGPDVMREDTRSSAFSNINGQIMFNASLDEYNSPNYPIQKLFKVINSRIPSDEKIPGYANAKTDTTGYVAEGHNYPIASIGEEYVQSASPIKVGKKLPVTYEAILYDKTGMILSAVRKQAASQAKFKENYAIDILVGAIDLYNRNGAGATATYSTGDNPDPSTAPLSTWTNDTGNNALEEYTDIQAAYDILEAMADPNTGEKILNDPTHLIFGSNLRWVANAIMKATQLRTGSSPTTIWSNYVDITSLTPVQSRHIAERVYDDSDYLVVGEQKIARSQVDNDKTAAETYWFLGQPQKAFAWRVLKPFELKTASEDHPDNFDRDIVFQLKMFEIYEGMVLDPRWIVRCSNTD